MKTPQYRLIEGGGRLLQSLILSDILLSFNFWMCGDGGGGVFGVKEEEKYSRFSEGKCFFFLSLGGGCGFLYPLQMTILQGSNSPAD